MKGEDESMSVDVGQALKIGDDVTNLRETLVRYIMADPIDLQGASTGIISFAADENLDLFVPHDGALMASQDAWDHNYLKAVKEGLLGQNFSRERFDHLVDVAVALQEAQDSSVPSRRRVHWISIGIVLFLCILGALVLAGPQVFRDIFQNSPLMG